MLKQKPKEHSVADSDDSDSTIVSLSSSQSSDIEPEINMVDELDMFHELDEKTQVMFKVSVETMSLHSVVLVQKLQ